MSVGSTCQGGSLTYCLTTEAHNIYLSIRYIAVVERPLHTDKKVAAQIPARIPYRVRLDISMGPILPNLFRSIGFGEDVRVMRGSRSEAIVGDMSCNVRAQVQRMMSLRNMARQETIEGAKVRPVSPHKRIHGSECCGQTANWMNKFDESERLVMLEREANAPVPI